MEILGIIKKISSLQTFPSGFKKRELIITTEEQYPQNILIEFIQDKCYLLNDFKIGDKVKISITLKGREWTNPEGNIKYFNSIQGWKIEAIKSSSNFISRDDFSEITNKISNELPSSETEIIKKRSLDSQEDFDDLPF